MQYLATFSYKILAKNKKSGTLMLCKKIEGRCFMKERKKAIQSVLFVITFTVLLVYFINHTSVITAFFHKIVEILFPFLIGCGIAFVVNIPMRGIENKLFHDKNKKISKFSRPISMVSSYLLMILVIAFVMFVVVPDVGTTVGAIRDKLPTFVEQAKEWIIQYTEKYPDITKKVMEFEVDMDKLGSLIFSSGGTILSTSVTIFSSIVSAIVNVFIGIVFSIYILSQKEKLQRQTKMICYAMFKESVADEILVFCKIANTTFSKFFASQFREGMILGTMFVIAMSIFDFPYPLTIGVLIAFTALIPIFGAFFGLFIGGFLILVVSPRMLLWFIVLFFVLQFIENYFIYPKLVGGDIGLSAIWVLLAVLVGGDLMGVVGMLVFIPLVSVLYSYFRSIIYRKLKKREINVDLKEAPDDAVPLMEGRRRLFNKKARNNSKPDEEESAKNKNMQDNKAKDDNLKDNNSQDDNA